MAEFDKKDTQDKIIDTIAEKLAIDKKGIVPDATLQNLGADSLDIVEFIMHFEDQFGIEINDEDAEKLRTLQDVVDYVHERRKK
jgi:acyl carrier protein